ncbi:hypothetical protein QE406_002034 [Microbacterium testaceum]|uniref:hypothetical protein n=1 Tax=Microbacterium testaceum TaxID=2033 RepID=UPI002786FB4C|nr:hypothetical protein [Microbacterium testaceum]MDQ1116025.1 hypothetical protein [Microbacterium testaceum]
MTYSMPPESFRTLRPEPVHRSSRTWDIVLTIVFLVLLPLAALAASYAGLFLAFASDACGVQNCNSDLMNLGLWSAVISPWVVLLIGGRRLDRAPGQATAGLLGAAGRDGAHDGAVVRRRSHREPRGLGILNPRTRSGATPRIRL